MPYFRSVLIGTDFSERAGEAFRVACALAEESKTRLTLLHVVEPPPAAAVPVASGELGVLPPPHAVSPAPHEPLRQRMVERYAPERPLDVEYLVRDGGAVDAILHAAGEVGADLIVLGTHGRTGLRRLLAGSTAEAVLRRATCPVLAVHAPEDHPPASGRFGVILHPTDYSDHSQAAFRVARALARDQGARLVLLHVEPVEVIAGMTIGADLDARDDSAPLAQMRAKAEGPDLKFPVETRYELGDPAGVILRAAGETGCDLIVLGSHGRTALGRALMGSVPEYVLRRAACPTLVVKPARPEPAGAGQKSVIVL